MIQNLFQIITVFLILMYIPCVCYSDWKTRTFNFLYFLPLAAWGMFTTILYLEESPARNFWLMELTLILCGIVLAAAIIGAIGGADFWFASMIMVFLQFNPLVVPRQFFALDFFWMLLLVTVCLPLVIYAYNCLEYHPPKTFIGKLTHFPDGVPFMIPISFAFVATLIVEMIL